MWNLDVLTEFLFFLCLYLFLCVGLGQVAADNFENDSEKAWLQEGLALQLHIREKDQEQAKKRTHKRKSNKRVSSGPSEPSLYPEVPIVDEARECAENLGKCSLEQLESVQHRKFYSLHIGAIGKKFLITFFGRLPMQAWRK